MVTQNSTSRENQTLSSPHSKKEKFLLRKTSPTSFYSCPRASKHALMEPLVSTSEPEFGARPPDEPSSSSHSRPRAPWTPMEHEVFLRALAANGRDWRRVSAVLQEAARGRGDHGAARSLAQVRNYTAQGEASGRFGVADAERKR